MNDALIDCDRLAALQGRELVRVVDCRHDLADASAGRMAYLESHIPGAVHADLGSDLSGPATTDHGRHPLPPPWRLREVFGRLGIAAGVRVVAYDDCFGMFAARLWWMLRYMGHEQVAVLDGGWPSWVGAGRPVCVGPEDAPACDFSGRPRRDRLVVLADVEAVPNLVDARDPVRFRGEREPIDARAGHIPGARNRFWRSNIGADGRFLDRAALRQQFGDSLGILPDAATVHYCGSGVSACHNVLAQVVAGYPEPRLYCGSWSEWCRDPARPVAPAGDTPT